MRSLDVLVVFIALGLFRYLSRKRRLPLAPGPKGYPIIGSLLDIPKEHPYLQYTQWAEKYKSEILNLNACGTNIVILNSVRVATELLDKRSCIYSSRPRFTMVSELMGWGFLFSVMPYNDEWRRRRRLFQRFFPSSRAKDFQPHQRTYIRQLLPKLIDQQNYVQSLRHFVGGIALNLGYGIDIKPVDDPYIKISEYAISLLNDACMPGKYLVDAVPLLKLVPNWFPGAKFKRDAQEWYKATMEFRNKPFEVTKRDLENGKATLSYTAICLESITSCSSQERLSKENDIKDTASLFFGAGADTSMVVLLSFVLAMVCYPEAQKKIQQELDAVVGPNRLPDFYDAPKLPYLEAVIRETMRWKPPAPVAVPHSTTSDDVFEGYFIPKDSIVMPNVWGMLQDPNVYPDPSLFIPERHLTSDGRIIEGPNANNPLDLVFGFGRRKCPGIHMALSTLYIVASNILHTMDICPSVDEDGNVVLPSQKCTDGLFLLPEPFDCIFRSRSEKAESLVRDEAL